MTATDLAPEKRDLGWHEAQPARWARERDELDATGWTYRVTATRRSIGLLVTLPIDRDKPLRLSVRFKQTYPWVPPDVIDVDGVLEGARHVNPWTRELCLVHTEDWDSNTTVAQLLRDQVPRLLMANASKDGSVPEGGIEMPAPEPIVAAAGSHQITLVVNDWDIPAHVDSGALVSRFTIERNYLGAGVVESLHAPGLDLHCDIDHARLAPFRVPIIGRWLRDPDYRVGETPAATWRRIAPQLSPLSLETEGQLAKTMPTDSMEIIGLLVPDEVTYRNRGESWIFLGRVKAASGRFKTIRIGTAYYSRHLLGERTPVFGALSHRDVVVVGLGALGMPLVQDLAQSGIGRMLVVDADTVDPRTSTRQVGALWDTGRPKAELASDLVRALAPYCDVQAVSGSLETLWERRENSESDAYLRSIRQRLCSADLVIDATANPPITRLLSEVRRRAGGPLLVVTGTARGWGGVVALLSERTGCWACVEHARHDGLFPVPPADPSGWVVPARCSDTTYTGARHESQLIAMHASAVAIARLSGEPMDSDYFVAAMRTASGKRAPITWSSTHIPRHPACPLHDPHGSVVAR